MGIGTAGMARPDTECRRQMPGRETPAPDHMDAIVTDA